MSIKTIDYRWRTKRGLQARLVVVFTLVMIGFLIMLLFGCFHPKRPKNVLCLPFPFPIRFGLYLTL